MGWPGCQTRSPLPLILSPDGGEEIVSRLVCDCGGADWRGGLFLSPSDGERIKVRGSLRQFPQDCVEYAAKIFAQCMVPKPNHFDSELGKKCVPLLVCGSAVGMSMFSAVQLDCEAGLSAIEVQVVRAQRMLPAKFVFGELPISQPAPKEFFCPG
jgi:hypothetical protein